MKHSKESLALVTVIFAEKTKGLGTLINLKMNVNVVVVTAKQQNSNLRKLYNVSGFCWSDSRCFKKHCQKSYSRKKTGNQRYTCFNLQCEPGETPENCPVQCCYKNNPSACTWEDNTCVDECCGEPSCCPTSAGNILNTDIRCHIVLFIAFIFII